MIINLTQHTSTPEQTDEGVVDLFGPPRAALVAALTFDSIPAGDEIERRAAAIVAIAIANGLGAEDGDDPIPEAAMIGGAPYLMPALEAALAAAFIRPLYAFSRRESIEQPQPDGSVRKVNVFRHVGFVPGKFGPA